MNRDETIEEQELGPWLMSLALDQRLEPDEGPRFEALMAQDPALREEWALWQALDTKLSSAPQMMPAVGFVTEFERKREQVERRQRLWFGLGIAVVAAGLWCTLLMGLLGAGAYVMSRGSDFLVALVHGAAYWYLVIQSQLDALLLTVTTLLSAPQFQLMLLVYTLAAGLALYGWVNLLRRSLRDAVDAQYSSRPS